MQIEGVGQGELYLGLRPVMFDLMGRVMIFLLWMLSGSDRTRSGGASGRLCSASGLGMKAVRQCVSGCGGVASGRGFDASGHLLTRGRG